MKIKFEEMPQSIQNIFRSRKNDCECRVLENRGDEVYYVKLDSETSKFVYHNGWQHAGSR